MSGRERCDEILRLIDDTLAEYELVVVVAERHRGPTTACMQSAAHRTKDS